VRTNETVCSVTLGAAAAAAPESVSVHAAVEGNAGFNVCWVAMLTAVLLLVAMLTCRIVGGF
jgi:hypothetical protein